jgi:hypothetical protein
MLVPSVGNIRGSVHATVAPAHATRHRLTVVQVDYPPAGPQPHFDRLRKVDEQVQGRECLVLHGTNSFAPELIEQCVASAVTKVNVNRLLLEVWSQHLRQHALMVLLSFRLKRRNGCGYVEAQGEPDTMLAPVAMQGCKVSLLGLHEQHLCVPSRVRRNRLPI